MVFGQCRGQDYVVAAFGDYVVTTLPISKTDHNFDSSVGKQNLEMPSFLLSQKRDQLADHGVEKTWYVVLMSINDLSSILQHVARIFALDSP